MTNRKLETFSIKLISTAAARLTLMVFLNSQEFIAASLNRETNHARLKIEQAFNLFDINQDGEITKEELE